MAGLDFAYDLTLDEVRRRSVVLEAIGDDWIRSPYWPRMRRGIRPDAVRRRNRHHETPEAAAPWRRAHRGRRSARPHVAHVV
jgi:hypothetical protein